MRIRKARMDDVEAMSRVLIDSITELCGADHGGEQINIARWTANKSPETLTRWIANPASSMFVAEAAGKICCVGSFSGAEIQLNYVAPDARFRGFSKAMLKRLEEEMHKDGVLRAQLTTTATAQRFYRAAGWTDTGEPEEMFGFAKAQPMSKMLG